MLVVDRALIVQFLKFAVIGFMGFCVDTTLVYSAIYLFGWGRYWSGLFAFPFAVSATWIGNRLFTFREVEHEPMAKQWAKFATVCGVGLVINRGTYFAMVTFLPLAYDYPVIALLGGTGAAMFFNFFISKKLVFKG